MDIATKLSLAISNFQKGQLLNAESLFDDILKADGDNIQALHLLAIIHAMKYDANGCIQLFDRALRIDPNNTSILKDYAKALIDLNLNENALNLLRSVIEKTPNDIEAKFNLSICLAKLSKFNDALHELDEILRVDPARFPALAVRSSLHMEKKEWLLALKDLDEAISLNKDFYDGYLNRAFIKKSMKNYEAALLDLDTSIALDPQSPVAYSHMGFLLHEMHENQRSLSFLNKATELDPNFLGGWLNKGVVLQALNCTEDALFSYDQALRIDPANNEALANKVSCLNLLGNPIGGLECAEKAIKSNPMSFNAWLNKGSSLKNLKQPILALEAYDKALEIQSNSALAIWNKSLIHLTIGNYELGLKEYEYRWKWDGADLYRHVDIPRLSSPAEIIDKKILCWFEQGYGDTIQFIRYIKKMKEIGAKEIILEIQPPLQDLLSCLGCRYIAHRDPLLEEVDFQIPLGSLPLLFDTRIETIPNQFPYITVSEDRINAWKESANLKNGKLNIGITCSGNLNFDKKNGNPRYLPLQNFELLMDVVNLNLIQTEVSADDQAYLNKHPEIKYLGNKINSFEDTAAIIMNMDAIVSIDTSVAHLAGALGKKTFVLLPWVSDWRWLLEGEVTPWYPDMKLYRQDKASNWVDSIALLQEEIYRLQP